MSTSASFPSPRLSEIIAILKLVCSFCAFFHTFAIHKCPNMYDMILFLYVHNCTQMASHTIFLFYYIFTYYSVFIHSATLETFRLFPVFPGMNYLVHIYLNVGVSLEDLSRCGITEFQELYIFTLTRDGQVSSLNDCSEDIPPNTV